MSEEQKTQVEEIKVTYKDKTVHVYCDEVMRKFLHERENGSLELAEYILKEYQCRMGKPLAIRRDSLAIEIIAHVYADNIAEYLQDLPEEHSNILCETIGKLGGKARVHTQTIDCGERSEDNNRFIWDGLEPFKDLICGIEKKNMF